MKILIVEDDPETATYIARGLRQEGHVIDTCGDAADALSLLGNFAYDIMILDRMLPGQDGLSLLRLVRLKTDPVRVLVLSALSGLDDRVEGLEAGGDDYLQKPFAFAELKARIDALGRRQLVAQAPTKLTAGDLEIDLVSRRVSLAGQVIDLLPKEFQLLEYFVRNQGRLLTRTMLLEQVWDLDFDPGSNVVETQISRLRARLERPAGRVAITTLRGAGYRLDVDE